MHSTAHSRNGDRRASILAASLLLLASTTMAAAGPPSAPVDDTIVSGARHLSAEEVRTRDITDTARGRAALEAERDAGDSLDVNRRTYRVYRFRSHQVIVGAMTRLRVVEGRNMRGEVVYEASPMAAPAAIVGTAGFAIPPNAAWQYNADGDGSEVVGTWKRTWFWTITKANNWKACSTCTAHDYWRIHGRLRAATLTGSAANEGFKRAWLEFDRIEANWTAVNENEVPQPSDSFGGNGTTTTTIGFATGLTVELGKAPLTGGGSLDTSYQGSMTRSTENWHPVVRVEDGSGGVQWCRYEFSEFTGTRTIATRLSARVAANGTNGGYWIHKGQNDDDNACPSQI